ncbi:nucleolar protein 14 [Paraphysoderma sedebokerense]|nr:nucleolar protein 14 [Paraphysoderma sedebokerense]
MGKPAKSKSGSALTRLKSTLKDAGVIGPKRQQLSKRVKKNKGLAKDVRKELNSKLDSIRKSVNPFEVKVTKQKHEVMGRKVKGAVGQPGIARQKSMEARAKTLVSELERRNKAGQFNDRRIGENNPHMSIEDKMLQRWTKERQKTTKGSVFNLDDSDNEYGGLTHMGKSIDDIDKFDDSMLDDEEFGGSIDKDTVGFTHFGGFDDGNDPDHRKSKAEVMKEVIAKSKMHKAERQKVKEENEDLRLQLDDELDSIRSLLDTKSSKPLERESLLEMARKDPKSTEDGQESSNTAWSQDAEYDKYVKQLAFEKRAQPTDRTKTEEEIAMEEKEKLEKLEKQRMKRMQGLSESDSDDDNDRRRKRRRPAQADDLSDDFVSDSDDDDDLMDDITPRKNNDGMPLTYRDGVLVNTEVSLSKRGGKKSDDQSSSGEDVESGSEESSDDEDESEDEDASDDNVESDEAAEETIDADDMSDWSDLEETAEDQIQSMDKSDDDLSQTDGKKDTTNQKPKKPSADLPYTFEAPSSHEDLMDLVANSYSFESIKTIVARCRVLYHPKLGAGNKQKLQTLLTLVLEHISHVENDAPWDTVTYVKTLYPQILELSQQFPEALGLHALKHIQRCEKELSQLLTSAREPNSSIYPSFGDLLLFKIYGNIFSTSDFHHPVITPAQTFLCQCLSVIPLVTPVDILMGIFITALLRQYQSLSKRYIPECINFISATLSAFIPPSVKQKQAVPGCFPQNEINTGIDLSVSGDLSNIDVGKLNFSEIIVSQEEKKVRQYCQSAKFKCELLSTLLTVVKEYATLYLQQPSFIEIFEPIRDILKMLGRVQFPTELQSSLSSLESYLDPQLSAAQLKRHPLKLQQHKPIPIQTFLPKFEDSYSLDRHYDHDKQRAETQKLKRQYKKEFKGAVRELRKDNLFLANLKLKEKKEMDKGYNEKIGKIMGQLGDQEGEWKKYQRQVKRLKKK